jgi:hypothetical protein
MHAIRELRTKALLVLLSGYLEVGGLFSLALGFSFWAVLFR